MTILLVGLVGWIVLLTVGTVVACVIGVLLDRRHTRQLHRTIVQEADLELKDRHALRRPTPIGWTYEAWHRRGRHSQVW